MTICTGKVSNQLIIASQSAQRRCQFAYGNIIGGDEVEIEDVETLENCAYEAIRTQPEATGVRIESHMDCYAVSGGRVVSSMTHRYCLLRGTVKCIVKLLVLLKIKLYR